MPRKKKIISPFDELLPYQRQWINDGSRFKIGLMARQTGKSWISAMEAVRDCKERRTARGDARPTTWVCLSAGERQSLEWMLKAREHVGAFNLMKGIYVEHRSSSEDLLNKAEFQFPNGSRIIAIPANPATARGYSANLILDEFAFHEQPDAIWRAIYPAISNPLKGQFKIRVVSTPNGLGNKFADLWQKPNTWSKHHVDIYEAVKAGLPLDVEELKAGLDDPEGWAQEYECQFMDAAAVLLPYELIASCESADATVTVAPEFWAAGQGRPLFMGIDFARRRDLSVAWTDELVGDVAQTREVLEMRDMSTPDQIELLRPRIRAARRVCLDYTGPGVGMGDYLVKEFGQYNPERHQFGKIELCTFTNTLKVEIYSKLRMVFERQKTRVPVSRAVREDLHSVQRVTTLNGNVTYRAPHSDDGHADRCTAKALANRAWNCGPVPFHYAALKNRPHPTIGRMGLGRLTRKVLFA